MSRKLRIGVHLNPQHGDFVDYRNAVLKVDFVMKDGKVYRQPGDDAP